MSLMPFALVVGILAGFLTGGRFSNLGDRTFSLWPLLIVGAAMQLAAEGGVLGDQGYLLVAGSFALIATFAAANLRYAGMGVILFGLLMNMTTIGANQGMPVEADAIVAAGIVDSPPEVGSLDLKAKRHVMTADDRFYWLSDVIPVRILGGQVLSFGDLVMCIGVVDLVANLLHPFPRRKRHRDARSTRATNTSVLEDDDAEGDVLDLRAWERSPRREVRA